MKLLLDQNLSRKIVPQLESSFSGSSHVTSVLSESADDSDIWEFAKANGYAIVTKDDDFEQLSVLKGHPPKVIWIRLGNCTTAEVLAVLEDFTATINSFLEDTAKSLLALP